MRKGAMWVPWWLSYWNQPNPHHTFSFSSLSRPDLSLEPATHSAWHLPVSLPEGLHDASASLGCSQHWHRCLPSLYMHNTRGETLTIHFYQDPYSNRSPAIICTSLHLMSNIQHVHDTLSNYPCPHPTLTIALHPIFVSTSTCQEKIRLAKT